MSRMKLTLSGAFAAVLLTGAIVAGQGATLPDRATIVTVSAPVTLPGVTLPAGSYLFRLADSQANRNIVQIFDKDRTKIFATLLAIPAQRDEVSDEAVITFKETRSDTPPAVHFWYYAGEKSGQEFAYPKDQAIKIANASGESVLAGNYASDIEGLKSTDVTRVKPNTEAAPAPAAQEPAAPPAAAPAEPQPATPPAATPTEQPAAPAAAAPPEPQAPAARPAPAPMPEMQPTGTSGKTTPSPTDRPARELPKTASELPLVGFAGLMALCGAIAVRALRRAVA